MKDGRAFILGLAVLTAVAGVGMARPAAAAPIVSTLTVAHGPSAVAVDAQTGRAFIATPDPSTHDDQIAVVNTATGRLVATTTIGAYASQAPGPLLVDQRASRVFALDADADTVSVLDARSGALLHNVYAGTMPQLLAEDERAGHVFVGALDLQLLVLDSRRGRVVRAVKLADLPGALAVDERNNRVFVGTMGGLLETIDARSGAVLNDTRVGVSVSTIAIDQRAGRVVAVGPDLHGNYGLNYGYAPSSDAMCLLDAGSGTLLATIALPSLSSSVVVSERFSRIVVASPWSYNVGVYDSRTGITISTLTTSFIPGPMAPDEYSGRVFITNQDAGMALMLDARTGRIRRSTLLTGQHHSAGWLTDAITLDERAQRLFVALHNRYSARIAVLDARSGILLRAIRVGAVATALTPDERAGRIVLTGVPPAAPAGPGPLDMVERSVSWLFGPRASVPLNHYLDAMFRRSPFGAFTSRQNAGHQGSVVVLDATP